MLQAAVFAQPIPSAHHEDILGAVLSLQFDTADGLILQAAGDIDPEQRNYLVNYNLFMQALVSGDRQEYDTYLESATTRIALIRASERPGSGILLSFMYLQSSLLSAFQNEYFDAARHYYYASRSYRNAEKRDPGYGDLARLGAILETINGSVPSEYAWLFRILGMSGSMEKGLAEMEELACSRAGSARLEACLLLSYASRLLVQERSGECCMQVVSTNYSNPLLFYAHSLNSLSSGKSRELLEDFGRFSMAPGAYPFSFLDLVEGEARLNILDPGAGRKLEEFLEGYRGEHYRKLAWHKLSWFYFLEGNMKAYQHARKQVLEQGSDVLDADRQARVEASDTIPVNPVLLRSRLLFDGGEYNRAMDLLEGQVPLTCKRDSVELIYRRGRILENMGEDQEAIPCFENVLGMGGSGDW